MEADVAWRDFRRV